MTPFEWLDEDEFDDAAESALSPVLALIVSDVVDRRGNYTCLATTAVGTMVSLGQVAN